MAAQIILFEHANCRGAHVHVFVEEADLERDEAMVFEDRIASFAVIEGSWTFWRDPHFRGPKSVLFGPGIYNWGEAAGIPNDAIASLSSRRD